MSTASLDGQYLTFRLDGELYAFDIAKVREVVEFSRVTHVPRTPEFMRGVINLRGTIVPVFDLKLKLGFAKTERTVDTCVIITEVDIAGEKVIVGALADSVQEVLELDPSQIDPPPRMGTRIDGECIRGMGKREDQFVMILDANRVLTLEDLAATRGVGGKAPAEHDAGPHSARKSALHGPIDGVA